MIRLKKTAILMVILTSIVLGAGTALAFNLIPNGDFELGYADFSSAYTYTPMVNNTSYQPPAIFDVGTDPNLGHSAWASYAAQSGSKMMIVNGAEDAGTNVWFVPTSSTIPVLANTWYYFSAWVASAYSTSPAVLQFSINSTLLGAPFTASATTGLWQQFYEPWYSGSTTAVTLSLVNQNTAYTGNDFTLDNIVLDTTHPNPVPIPAAVWLFGTGLLGLFGVRRKMRK